MLAENIWSLKRYAAAKAAPRAKMITSEDEAIAMMKDDQRRKNNKGEGREEESLGRRRGKMRERWKVGSGRGKRLATSAFVSAHAMLTKRA